MARPDSLIEEKRQRDHRKAFDVAIIGSGFAGVSCALVLGRHFVRTIMFDGGRTRNASTRRIHGYLGFENKNPMALLKSGMESVREYESVTIKRAKVTSLSKSADDSGFNVRAAGTTYRVKFVLIATGVRDIKPKAAGFEKFDGDGAWHCPYCDGHEVAGKRLAIIVSGKRALAYVKEFLGWTRDITAFPYNIKFDERELEQAAALGIKIANDRIIRVSGRSGRNPKRLVGRSGTYTADVIFYRLGYLAQTRLAEQVGCRLHKGYIKVDSKQRTSVPGVYAAGDVDTDRHLVVLAAAAGSRAAVDIYESLLSEAVRAKIKGHKSHKTRESRWKGRHSGSGR